MNCSIYSVLVALTCLLPSIQSNIVICKLYQNTESIIGLTEFMIFDNMKMVKQLHHFHLIHHLLHIIFIIIICLDPLIGHQLPIFDYFH